MPVSSACVAVAAAAWAPGSSSAMDRQRHWDRIYRKRSSDELSWYQAHPATSLRLIASTGVGKEARIIDAGGGDSRLVDRLLDQGYGDITVIDVSAHALHRARERLGDRARLVNWICGDLLEVHLAETFDIWHDRAVFHFLTDAKDRAAYVRAVLEGLRAGGHLIMATFGPDAPPKCSGLDVVRYSAESLANALGDRVELLESLQQQHITPGGINQQFIYTHFVVGREAQARTARPTELGGLPE